MVVAVVVVAVVLVVVVVFFMVAGVAERTNRTSATLPGRGGREDEPNFCHAAPNMHLESHMHPLWSIQLLLHRSLSQRKV